MARFLSCPILLSLLENALPFLVVSPPSHCPGSCGHLLSLEDLPQLFSYRHRLSPLHPNGLSRAWGAAPQLICLDTQKEAIGAQSTCAGNPHLWSTKAQVSKLDSRPFLWSLCPQGQGFARSMHHLEPCSFQGQGGALDHCSARLPTTLRVEQRKALLCS